MSRAAVVICSFILVISFAGCAVQGNHVEVATEPIVLYAPGPQYPESARLAGVSGEVILKVTVDPFGGTSAATVSSETPPGHGFGKAALAAVKEWVWEPGKLQGRPVNQGRQVRVKFSAYDREASPVPLIASKTEPQIPQEFAKSGERAAVLVLAEVASDGRPYSVSVLKELPGPKGLAGAALDCVKQWRFYPGTTGMVTVLVPFGPKQAPDSGQ